MSIIDLFQTNTVAFALTALVFGLIIGSFLNVVIHRLPIMLFAAWDAQCGKASDSAVDHASGPRSPVPGPGECGNASDSTLNHAQSYNLVQPRSRCPHCEHLISAWENIPLLSYLWLKGRCRACGARISWRYPAIELVTGLATAFVAWHFGAQWSALGAWFLTWALIALAAIDFEHQLLPDAITLPFAWLGLLFSLGDIFTDPRSAIIGAVSGYLALWSVYQLFRLVTGKEGMGYGDFKLLALLGAWLGWQRLPLVILLSAGAGAVIGSLLIVLERHERQTPIPFGPYLAAAGWIALLWGNDLTRAYLHFTGFGA
jgi:leader peptidase (prepilin peptidase)/N-methyltransferase